MAEAIPFTLGASPDLVDVAIQDIWLKTSKEETDFYKQYMNVETGITDLYTKDSSLSGLGQATRILDNAVITAQSPIQGNDQVYTQVHYGTLLRVSKMMWFFGIKKRDLERVASQARRACSVHRETFCADRLDNSFSTSYTRSDDSGNYTVTTAGGNSVELISAAQTREDGGTDNNNRVTDGSTVNMDFDYDAVKAVQYTASALSPLKDPKGINMHVNPDTFIFTAGHANFFKAQEILGAIRRGHKPQSAEYDGSGVPAFKTVALPWIENNKAYWWALDSSMKNAIYGLQYKESQPIKLDGPNIVFTTKEIIRFRLKEILGVLREFVSSLIPVNCGNALA